MKQLYKNTAFFVITLYGSFGKLITLANHHKSVNKRKKNYKKKNAKSTKNYVLCNTKNKHKNLLIFYESANKLHKLCEKK